MFREDTLLKAGVIMMTFALALTVVAVVVTLLLRNEPERAVALEKAAAKSSVEPLVRGESPYEPWVEPRLKPEAQKPESEPPVGSKAQAQPQPRPQPEPEVQPEP